MRKTILVLAATLSPLCLIAQNGYTIKARIGRLGKPAKAFLLVRHIDREVLDSTDIVDGKFEFKGSMESPTEAQIRVRHDGSRDDTSKASTYDLKPLLLYNETITLTAKDSVANAVITGSALNAESAELTVYLRPIYDQYRNLDNEFKAQPETKKKDRVYIETLQSRAKVIEKEIVEAKLKYIAKNPDHYVSLMTLSSLLYNEFDVSVMEKVFLGINKRWRTSNLGKEIAAKIAAAKRP